MAATSLEQWAIPNLQQLLPLDDDSLRQVVQYADSLSKDAAAEHLKNFLGDGAKALEFISGFNLRRRNSPSATAQASNAQPTTSLDSQRQTATATGDNGPPRHTPARGRGGKKRPNIHSLPARQLEGHGNVGGGYVKSREEADYMPQSSRAQQDRQKHKEAVADNLALIERRPDATQMPLITDGASNRPPKSKPPPSAAGQLVGDVLSGKESKSAQTSRHASPAPKAKVTIAGGTAMHGASTALDDLDSAIRSLEVQTNPTLPASAADIAAANQRRRCNCMATRHALLDIAPNCLHCGKVICVKEGLGPCTFCGERLLSAGDIDQVLRVLKDERGQERMKLNNASQRKPDVALGKARALTGRDFLAASSSSNRSSPLSSAPTTPAGSDDEASDKARAHRDKLLGFQAQNARRTQIHDEAADFDIPTAGTNMWASPADRAKQLKKQQKLLREMEWNARPDYEKRRVVASIDLQGRKVVRRMAEVEKPDFDVGSDAEPEEGDHTVSAAAGGGAFSNNPLAKGLIKPRAKQEKGKDAETGGERQSSWRRVQMDEDDNEAWILDGGIYGGRVEERVLGAEEHAFG